MSALDQRSNNPVTRELPASVSTLLAELGNGLDRAALQRWGNFAPKHGGKAPPGETMCGSAVLRLCHFPDDAHRFEK